jgi:hypothetical protein
MAEPVPPELAEVERRLIAVFATIEPDEVRQCVRTAAQAFEGAAVRSYLPLLVERRAATELRALASGVAPRRSHVSDNSINESGNGSARGHQEQLVGASRDGGEPRRA